MGRIFRKAIMAGPATTSARRSRAPGIGHFRANYRIASHNVHANPKGVFFKLGMLAESQVLLAGPSNAGLADPGHGAALSLSRVTAALVGLQQPPTLDNLDNNVALLMMVQLGDVKRSSGRLIFYEKTVVSRPQQPLGHLSPLNHCVTDQPQSQARAISQKA
jgi:hypothetical protein